MSALHKEMERERAKYAAARRRREVGNATAAELRRDPPMPWSRVFNDVKTPVPVSQVALMTSLQINFGCMLTGWTDRGNDIADLLEDAIDFMDPLKYGDLWSKTPL